MALILQIIAKHSMKNTFIFLIAFLGLNDLAAQEIDSLDIKIGQMIMIGIGDRQGLNGDDPLVADLQKGIFGGVIIYEKNVAKEDSKAQLRALVDSLNAYSPTPLFVSIDEEGGKVHRLEKEIRLL